MTEKTTSGNEKPGKAKKKAGGAAAESKAIGGGNDTNQAGAQAQGPAPKMRPRIDFAARQQKKEELARDPNSRVVLINSAFGETILNLTRNMDTAMAKMKSIWGEPGRGISLEEGVALHKEAQELQLAYAKFIEKMCDRVKVRFYVPFGLEEHFPEAVKRQKDWNKSREKQPAKEAAAAG